MKRLIVAVLLALTSPAFGASLGYQQSTSLSTSSAINLPSAPSNAGSALVSAESSAVRWRDDGTDPTSSVGNPVPAGSALCYGNEIAKFRVIGQTSGATIDVTYYAGKNCAQ